MNPEPQSETTCCNLCRSDNAETVFTGHDLLHDLPGEFSWKRCRRCGLLYLSPRPGPENMARYYPADYMPFVSAIEEEAHIWRRWDRRYGMAKRCKIVTRHAGHPGRLLDVGCATGVFLDAMRRYGWDVQGVEPNEAAATYAREKLDLNVFAGDLCQAEFPAHAFDAVTLWDVLEHVYDPRATLAELARILRPGGLLVLSLPNPESWEVPLLGRYWAGWDVPRHLHLFTRPVLNRYLNESGFRMENMVSFSGRYHVLLLGLEMWAGERVSSAAVRRAMMATLRSWPARLAGLAFYTLADRVRLSSSTTVFARRQETGVS